MSYETQHRASVVDSMAKGRTPRTLGEYLTWFGDRWRAEMPTQIHGAGVWRDFVPAGEAGVGGSVLGTTRYHDPFRRLLENSPYEVEYAVYDNSTQTEPHYVRPIHAAIARISTRRPRVALWLSALAGSDFDWVSLVERRGWQRDEGEVFLEAACYLLFREFDVAPRSRRE